MALAPAVRGEQLNVNLARWQDVENAEEWRSLLVGNGLSQNLWAGFGYDSLFDLAHTGDGAHLDCKDIALFDQFQTRNFETVLGALSTSKVVATTLEQPTSHLDDRLTSIRNALARTVRSVHVPQAPLRDFHLARIHEYIRRFNNLYSTNYDLLLYWSIMQSTNNFRDFFFNKFGEFDIENTDVRGNACAVHFLHGGLHLYRLPNGGTLKRIAQEGRDLLELFEQPYRQASPLFVSEGASQDKLSTIYRSDYLSFVFSRLEADVQPLVVFGHSLGESDRHIARAIGAREGRKIAVSVRSDGDIRAKKAALRAALPRAELYFYDAATHPLGAQDLKVEPEVQ
jgi:hypothetical protein